MDTPIAAGSLFTSCVTNTEPQGIKDIREAKANYLDALANLRAADAEKVKAEATLVQAQAATEQARAALEQAKAKEQEIKNDKTAADNAIALEKARKDAEVYLAQQEKVLAEAEEALRAYLVKVEEQSKQLTWTEQQIVWAYTQAYNNVIDKQKAVRDAEANLYDVTYNYAGENYVEAAKAEYEQEIVLAEQSKVFFEAELAAAKDMSDENIANYEEWVEKYDALKDQIAGFAYDKAEIAKDSALNEYENKVAIDSFYGAIAAKRAAIKEATAPFKLEFTGDKALALPKLNVTGTNVVENFAEAVNDIKVSAGWIRVGENLDTLGLKFGKDDQEVAGKAVDTLNIIIDALKREQVVVDQLVKDTAGIAALVERTEAEYKAVKDTLEKGVAAYKPIADAKAAAKAAEEAYKEANAAFEADTAALIGSIRDFVEVWNDNVDDPFSKKDSTALWDSFITIMKARETALEYEGEKLYYYYYKYKVSDDGEPVWDKDSTEFSKLKFSGIQVTGEGYRTTYGGQSEEKTYSGAFQLIVSQAMNSYFLSNKMTLADGNLKLTSEITFEEFSSETDYFKTLFFDKYQANYSESGEKGKIYTGGKVYVSEAVTTAKNAAEEAKGAIETAKTQFYTDIYEKFWGVAFTTSEDSLKIVYTEKTFTEPTVLPKFVGNEGFFTPAEGKSPASIDFEKVTLKESKALDVIKAQFGGTDYLKPSGDKKYTLYAKYLATAQFASDAKNYKENTTALNELVNVVATVQTAYNAAVAAQKAGSALADSLVTKLIGKPAEDVEASDSVSVANKNITTFISKDGKGTFKLAGEQKELAEKWLTDYAKTYSELEAEKKAIDVTIDDNNALAEIYEDYVEKLAEIERRGTGTPDEILAAVKGYWYGYDVVHSILGYKWTEHITGVLEKLQANVDDAAEAVKVAEGKLAKLEAGYDQTQIDIEAKQDALAKAQQALEQAEVEFAAAEAAYKAVLEAHGITE